MGRCKTIESKEISGEIEEEEWLSHFEKHYDGKRHTITTSGIKEAIKIAKQTNEDRQKASGSSYEKRENSNGNWKGCYHLKTLESSRRNKSRQYTCGCKEEYG